MGKNTPGPWKLDASTLTVTTPDAVEARIAEIDGDNCDWEQAEADARLIAAAPDMLEALEEARTQVAILQDRLGIRDTGAGTLSIIDAALAKAKGGSE